MTKKTKLTRIAAAVALTIGMSSGVALAQETTSAVRGVVSNEQGQTVANATIQLIDTRTGTSRTLTSNANGTFNARGLAVGGPYMMVVEGPEGRRDTVENVFLSLGDTQNVSVTIRSQEEFERIAVTGSRMSDPMIGRNSPAAVFSQEDLENAPAINRDIKDVLRIDPRVYVDESFGDAIQCGGAHPRYNSLTVDGVRMNDNFGLNSNGYPTERIPFSFDAIQQVAVEFAPFDVQYGNFTACNINAVTKSGGNELFGSAFFDYTSDSLSGDSLEGDNFDNGDYTEERYGFNVGGALIKDKLFFFTAYEKLEGVENFSFGPADSTAATQVAGVTQSQIDRIAQIASERYGYQVGQPIASAPVEDEKLLVKLDWYINDDHRLAYTYNYNDGGNVRRSDGDSDEYEFSDHFYNRSTKLESHVAQLFSDWTYDFSTEVRVGSTSVENSQVNNGPGGFGEVQIATTNIAPDQSEPSSATVYLGVDDSRQSNSLSYDSTFFNAMATYQLNDHTLSAGFEREEFDIFNMFVQHSIGEYRFDSIDAFEAGTPSVIYYGNAADTLNPRDAAAEYSYAINTAYLQDEYYHYDWDVTFTFGLRYDWYTSSDLPAENANFTERYGYSNAQNFDGEGLLQPRFGFNWRALPELEVRGGIGLYSGGNPNVWVANGYQNDGITQVQLTDRTGQSLFDREISGDGNPIANAPADMVDQVANASPDSGVNTLDPNFEIPSEWKYALGATYSFDSGYVVNADLIYTQKKDSVIVYDGSVEQTDTLPDGRPLYSPIFENSDGELEAREDFILGNAAEDGKSVVFSTSLSKSYDFGLSWSLAYAYADAEDANPMTSSVAYSNWSSYAASDFNNPGLATSNYEIPHRFTMRATYQHEFVSGYNTTFSLVGTHNKGRPYSYTFSGQNFGDGGYDRQLLYVPTGIDDPNVVFGADFNTDAFFDFVQNSGLDKYAGGIADRNAFYSDWWTKVDLRIEQELPGFMENHRAKAFFTINNLTNLLNDDWGVMYQAGFPQMTDVVNVDLVGSEGNYQYQFNEFFSPSGQSRVQAPSVWEIRVGVKYDF
ncbi:TonB-dependent receptor [Aliidiomarina sedimenti]|uniref:TonB-dependent receptor n=1 Tax=Aliidiomarina sedimenti TaxID=1933879 RepID=A0ABY0BXE9_9GAMM|nr:TonB-dependent receptor [Aliidiomarina sedimenti]RUO29158.1 TonB-dependent receptor [Aliidiomarina sedimenti]